MLTEHFGFSPCATLRAGAKQDEILAIGADELHDLDQDSANRPVTDFPLTRMRALRAFPIMMRERAAMSIDDEDGDPALTASAILERMAATYATCRSYRDRGQVETVFLGDRRRIVRKPFRTAFVRPDRFRFEYEADGVQQMIVWRHGREVKTWCRFLPGRGPRSLENGLAAATGVSGGSAHTIPALLLPDEVGGRRLTDLIRAERVEDGVQASAPCFRIRGSYAGHSMTLWLDRQTLLVRRIDEQSDHGDFRTEDVTTYEAAIDAEVPDASLALDVPEA